MRTNIVIDNNVTVEVFDVSSMQKYFDYIDDDELRAFFAGAVKIPSINPPGNEAPMLQYIEDFLKASLPAIRMSYRFPMKSANDGTLIRSVRKYGTVFSTAAAAAI